MKKLTSLLALILALALVLAGCGGSTKDVGGSVAQTPSQPENQTPETTAQTEPENLLDIGRMEGGTYTNTYAGFGCTVDTNWVYYSAEELQEMPGNVRETLKGTDMGDALANVQQFTDMMVQDSQTGSNVNVLYQKLDLQTRLVYAAMSLDQVLDATLESKADMISAYETMGMTDVDIQKATATFLGEEVPVLYTTAMIQGVPVYMAQVYEHQLGDYIVVLTATAFGEDTTADLLNMFFPVE